MNYDVKCATLARQFLADADRQDDEALVAELAKDIQNAIEDFFSYKEIDR